MSRVGCQLVAQEREAQVGGGKLQVAGLKLQNEADTAVCTRP